MQRRNTRQKKTVYDSLMMLGHANMESLINYIKMQDKKISLATIYRNVSVLLSEGKVRKVKLENEEVLETVKEEHFHFVCEKCGKIVDVEKNNNISFKDEKELSLYQVNKYDIILYGLCPKCKGKGEI